MTEGRKEGDTRMVCERMGVVVGKVLSRSAELCLHPLRIHLSKPAPLLDAHIFVHGSAEVNGARMTHTARLPLYPDGEMSALLDIPLPCQEPSCSETLCIRLAQAAFQRSPVSVNRIERKSSSLQGIPYPVLVI